MEDPVPYGKIPKKIFIVYDFRNDPVGNGNTTVSLMTVYTYDEAIKLIPLNYRKVECNEVKNNNYYLLLSISQDGGSKCEFYIKQDNNKSIRGIATLRAISKGTSIKEELLDMKAEIEKKLYNNKNSKA